VQRPSLEYQHAFDLCAVEVHRIRGPVAVFASSPFYGREVLKRLEGCEAGLVPMGGWISSEGDMRRLLGPEVEPPDVQTLESMKQQVKAAVWAEPEREHGEQALNRISQALLPGGRLYVIVSGWPARFLPEWRQVGGGSSERPAGLWRTSRRLRQGGFRVETLYGFHGPVSVLWGYASRCMTHLGRGDWADRCHFKMRAEYVAGRWQALWAPVSVAVARRR
jgi:hypothetical protein